MLGSTCFSKPGSLGVGSQEGENQLESASTLCAHGQAPRKCSGSLKTFSLGLAEILGISATNSISIKNHLEENCLLRKQNKTKL